MKSHLSLVFAGDFADEVRVELESIGDIGDVRFLGGLMDPVHVEFPGITSKERPVAERPQRIV